jgi:flavorubredoxin
MMTFAPVEPAYRVEPELIGPETFVVRSLQPALGAPLSVYLNSLVIRGAEPVIVDTGTIANRKQWLDDVFGLVEPTDVRWVFLSHDDIDHTGNLEEVMAACPNATLVASWAITERHSNAFEFPLERCRWINDGSSIIAGDRELVAVRPPMYDSPTTRGLFDASTGVYWAVDCFASPVPGNDPVTTVAELEPNFWREGMTMFMHHALSPWLSIVDPVRFAAVCDENRKLGMTTIATAHAPVITAQSIDAAYELARSMPTVTPPPAPDQNVLDEIIAATAA